MWALREVISCLEDCGVYVKPGSQLEADSAGTIQSRPGVVEVLFCLFSSLNFQETRIWVSIRRQCRSRAGVAAMCVPPAFLSNCCFPPASLEGCPPPPAVHRVPCGGTCVDPVGGAVFTWGSLTSSHIGGPGLRPARCLGSSPCLGTCKTPGVLVGHWWWSCRLHDGVCWGEGPGAT